MTTFQYLWVSFFSFGTAIHVGIVKGFWHGIFAYLLYVVIGFVLSWTSIFLFSWSKNLLNFISYAKHPFIIAVLVEYAFGTLHGPLFSVGTVQ